MLSPSTKPTVSIDNTLTKELEEEVRAGRASLDDGVPLPLSKSDKAKIGTSQGCHIGDGRSVNG